MRLAEKVLYHQIHPVKLLTDWATAFLAAYFLWHHRPLVAALVGLVPPVVASMALIRFGRLERYKATRFGSYVAQHMTRAMEALRLLGVILFWSGAWVHRPVLLAGGLVLILGAWLRGTFWPARQQNASLASARDASERSNRYETPMT